eukprot:scaffold16929_cov65-Phaeocystis_antarctica.AAC.1
MKARLLRQGIPRRWGAPERVRNPWGTGLELGGAFLMPRPRPIEGIETLEALEPFLTDDEALGI